MSLVVRLIGYLVFILLFASTRPAVAELRVPMANDLQAGRHFMVETRILYGGIHGSHAKLLDRSFLSAGEEKRITVLAVVPFFYGRITAFALHPAYYHGDSVMSDKIPFAYSADRDR